MDAVFCVAYHEDMSDAAPPPALFQSHLDRLLGELSAVDWSTIRPRASLKLMRRVQRLANSDFPHFVGMICAHDRADILQALYDTPGLRGHDMRPDIIVRALDSMTPMDQLPPACWAAVLGWCREVVPTETRQRQFESQALPTVVFSAQRLMEAHKFDAALELLTICCAHQPRSPAEDLQQLVWALGQGRRALATVIEAGVPANTTSPIWPHHLVLAAVLAVPNTLRPNALERLTLALSCGATLDPPGTMHDSHHGLTRDLIPVPWSVFIAKRLKGHEAIVQSALDSHALHTELASTTNRPANSHRM